MLHHLIRYHLPKGQSSIIVCVGSFEQEATETTQKEMTQKRALVADVYRRTRTMTTTAFLVDLITALRAVAGDGTTTEDDEMILMMMMMMMCTEDRPPPSKMTLLEREEEETSRGVERDITTASSTRSPQL